MMNWSNVVAVAIVKLVKRRRGRPKVVENGVFVGFKLPSTVLAALDAYAGRRGLGRAAALRAIVGEGLRGSPAAGKRCQRAP